MGRDSYIVRIYNRPELIDLKESESITGIVEDAETGTKYTFHNKEELWSFVANHQSRPNTKN